jgi:uncharacterized membrane protein YoaK (UPF0700 family)
MISGFALYVSIILAGLAMGIQSATIRHLNIPGIITTFLTGTITSIGMSMVKGIKSGFNKKVKRANPAVPSPKTLEQRIELQVIVFMAYAGTAVFTGWMEFHRPRFLPLLPLILVISVLLIVVKQPGHPHLQSNEVEEG